LRSTSTPQPSAPAITTADEDPFLRQLREAREALSTDETWFKTHTSELEKEIDQQEDLRRSLGSNSNTSQDNSLAHSTNGFARSMTGYEYVPPELKPGQTLSRTEERIQRTGARGLANKPIGGAPKPVAMSRRTATQLQNTHSQNVLHGRKRSFEEVDHVNGHADHHIDYQLQPAAQLVQQVTTKKLRPNGVTTEALEALQRGNRLSLNPFHGGSLDDGLDDEGDETEEYEDADDAEQAEEQVVRGRYNGAVVYEDDADVDVDAEAEGDYEDEDEDEEYDEEGDDLHQEREVQYPGLQAYGEEYELEVNVEVEVDEQGIPLPPRSRSAATSTPDTGMGSTVEAAIELSD